MGALFGVEAAPISSARVLELGCGDAENLLPMAVALPDAQARRRSHVTTLRHRSVRIEDELGRHLVTLLDGTRNREALLQEVEDFRREGASPPGKDLAEGLERSLEGLAQMGLLVAEAG